MVRTLFINESNKFLSETHKKGLHFVALFHGQIMKYHDAFKDSFFHDISNEKMSVEQKGSVISLTEMAWITSKTCGQHSTLNSGVM